jgi:hypothetical protein
MRPSLRGECRTHAPYLFWSQLDPGIQGRTFFASRRGAVEKRIQFIQKEKEREEDSRGLVTEGHCFSPSNRSGQLRSKGRSWGVRSRHRQLWIRGIDSSFKFTQLK